MKLLGRQTKNVGKKTLVLGLDETLIHSVFSHEKDADFQYNLVSSGKVFTISTYKRPYLDKFIEHVSKKFELVFYTSGVAEYSNLVINSIDTQNTVSGRLFRDSCKLNSNQDDTSPNSSYGAKGIPKNSKNLANEVRYLKDIPKLGRLMSNIIVLDSNTMTCSECIQNTVPIRPWFRSKDDTELKEILPILDSLAKVKDVRVVIQNIIDKMSDNKEEKKGKYRTPYDNPKNIKYKDR